MAVSLSSNHPFLYASSHVTKQPSNSHKTIYLPFNFPSKNHNYYSPLSITQKYPLSSYSKYNHGNHAFKCFVSAQNLPFTTVKEEKEEGVAESTYANIESGSIETLTRFYKEAILAEDYQTIAEIESSFYQLQNVNNELVEKISTISEEITAGKARYIRLQADFDNFRRRSEKERLSARSDAQGEVIESLLPMMDNFERAKLQIKPETVREKQIETSYQGIHKQFLEIMRSLRVSIIATVGKPFDPSLHEAIAREDSEEYKEGIVSQELRRGFLLGDRLLRPAMVKVSSGSSGPPRRLL